MVQLIILKLYLRIDVSLILKEKVTKENKKLTQKSANKV